MKNKRVCVAIVTYNRKELLVELLESLSKQTYSVSAVMIVDNNSTDGTPEYVIEKGIVSNVEYDSIVYNRWNDTEIMYYRNSENAGGSGGFAKAFELIMDQPFECVWAMDDDVNPEHNCLEELMKYLDDDAKVCVPCRGDENYVDYAIQGYDLETLRYFHFQDCKRNRIDSRNIQTDYVEIQDMAFEGPLFSMDLVREIGIPDKGYFILFDDTDYARRACQKTKMRYVVGAKLHKKVFPPKVSSSAWGWKAYYKLRNSIYLEKKYAKNFRVKYIRGFLRVGDLLGRAVLRGRFLRARLILRAYYDGLTGRMGRTYAPEEIVSD